MAFILSRFKPFSAKYLLHLFVFLIFSGKPKGTGLDIDVTVHDKAERPMICEASSDSDSYVNYTAWNEIAVRFQDNQSLVRIFLNNKLVKVKRFFGFDSFPADAQLHLAQLFEVELESTGSISERFKVSCVVFLQRRTLF